MSGTGPYAELMARRFQMAVKRLGLNQPLAPARHRQIPQAAARGRPAVAALRRAHHVPFLSWPANAGHPGEIFCSHNKNTVITRSRFFARSG